MADIETKKAPESQQEVYPLTKKLKKIDLSQFEGSIKIGEDEDKKSIHSLEGGILKLIPNPEKPAKNADKETQELYKKDWQMAHNKRMAILARTNLYGIEHNKAGEEYEFKDGFLLIKQEGGLKRAINITDEKTKKPPEGYKLLSKREDIRIKTRRAWQNLDELADSGILSRVLQATGHETKFGPKRLAIWKEMKNTPDILLKLKTSHKQLRDISNDFFDQPYTGHDGFQQRAMIEFLRMKHHEKIAPSEKPSLPSQPDAGIPKEKPKTETPDMTIPPEAPDQALPKPPEQEKAIQKKLESIGKVEPMPDKDGNPKENEFKVTIKDVLKFPDQTDTTTINYIATVKFDGKEYDAIAELPNGEKFESTGTTPEAIKKEILAAGKENAEDIHDAAQEIIQFLKSLKYSVIDADPFNDNIIRLKKEIKKDANTIATIEVQTNFKKQGITTDSKGKSMYTAKISIKEKGKEIEISNHSISQLKRKLIEELKTQEELMKKTR